MSLRQILALSKKEHDHQQHVDAVDPEQVAATAMLSISTSSTSGIDLNLVEVLPGGGKHAAGDLPAQSVGNVDAAYRVGSSVGLLLAAAEHGLNTLPTPTKKEEEGEKDEKGEGKKKKEKKEKKKVCVVDGCANISGNQSFCGRHRKKPCSIKGCVTNVKARGLCGKHGARSKLNKLVPKKKERGGDRGGGGGQGETVLIEVCAVIGCFTTSGSSTLCSKHRGKKKEPSGKRKRKPNECFVSWCSNKINARGLCTGHAANICRADGCTTKAQARGVCLRHGSNGKCGEKGCTTNARKLGGNCNKHTDKLVCAALNCSTNAISGKRLCTKHGAHGICAAWRCKTNAYEGKNGLCTKHFKAKEAKEAKAKAKAKATRQVRNKAKAA